MTTAEARLAPLSLERGRQVGEPNLTTVRHLANAIYRAMKMGFLFDLANPLGTPQAPLKSIAGARIKQQGGSKYDPTNHRLLVYAFANKRLGVPAMRCYLDLEGFEKLAGNLPRGAVKAVSQAAKLPDGYDEVFYAYQGSYYPVENLAVGSGMNRIDARGAPEAFELLARQCFMYNLVQYCNLTAPQAVSE